MANFRTKFNDNILRSAAIWPKLYMQMPRAGGSTTNSAERRGEYETFHRDIIRFCTHVERDSVHIFKKGCREK